MPLCLQELAELTRGELRFAMMPPRDGEFSIVQRVVVSADLIRPNDLFWRVSRQPGAAELAFLRGAIGVVANEPIEPWPGRFSLLVADPVAALQRIVDAWIDRPEVSSGPLSTGSATAKKETSSNLPELKVLQLCAGWGVDIYSPTCGREANERKVHGCRRRAA